MILPEKNFKPTAEIPIKSPVYFTGFYDKFALVKRDCKAINIDDLADLIRETTRTSKKDLPWIKLARFSGIPNPKATKPDFPSMRYDDAVVEIRGVEGDYDGGKVRMATAASWLADIERLIYSTPSSTPEAPRWRVLAPTSKPYPPASRTRFLARINGKLGGALADESFVLSQAYHFGGLVTHPVEVIVIQGRRVDLCDDLDALARHQHGATEPPKPRPPRQAPVDLQENDDNPVLLAEGFRRVRIHIHRRGIGEEPRGQRAYSLAAWLADMRTSIGEILSVKRIVELMQTAGYGEIEDDILDRRQYHRGCELVLSLAEKLDPLLGEVR